MDANFSCDTLLSLLVKDVGSLWQCRRRGESLEVSTPFSTVTQRFVSVFIGIRDAGYVVGDGGWLSEGYYHGHDIEGHLELSSDLVKFFSEPLGILTVKVGERTHFFKRCGDSALLSSAVYDLANFVVNFIAAEAFSSHTTIDDKPKKPEMPPNALLMKAVIDALTELGGSGRAQEINRRVVKRLMLPEDVITALHKPGKSKVTELSYRLGWIRTELKKQGAIGRENGGWRLL